MKQSSKGRQYRCHTCYQCAWQRAKSRMTEEQRLANNAYGRQWIKKNRSYARYKAYASKDKRRGYLCSSWEELKDLFTLPCYYCTSEDSIGLDRMDNTRGHELDNVKPCCSKCNMIMSDLPPKAREVLKPALLELHKGGLLNEWQIPTKRKT